MLRKNNKLLQAVATVTVFSVFTRGISFLFKIYLSRALGAEVMGLYQICISVFYLFASLSASGIPLVLSRKTSEMRVLNGKDDYSLLSSALLLGVIISLSTIIVLSLSRPILSSLLKDGNTVPMFLFMLPALLSTTIYSIIRGFFWGKKDFTSFSITETIEEILRIIFTALFIGGIIGGISGAYGIAIAFTISDMLVAIILLIMYFAKGGTLSKPSKIKEILLPATPVTLMRIFGGLITAFTAILLPARLIDAGFSVSEATAGYGRIAGMANPLLLAPNAIISSLAIVLIPEMSENKAKNDFPALNRQLNNGINFSFIISGVFMILYFSLGEQITTVLYNDVESGQYLKYASLIMLPMCANQLSQSTLNSIGKELSAFINFALSSVLILICLYFLPAYIGIFSVAVATLISILFGMILNLVSLRKHTSFYVGFYKNALLIFIFAIPCSFLAKNTFSVLSGIMNDLLALILTGILVGVVYAVLCVMTDTIDIKGFIRLKLHKN